MIPATAAIVFGAGVIVWQTVIAAPALSFGTAGQVYLAEKDGVGPTAVASPSDGLMCFEAITWRRLCPGQTYAQLSPSNVSVRDAHDIDLASHVISVAPETGPKARKCRGEKIPAGLAPGIWRLSGRATNQCSMWLPLIGEFTVSVTSDLPSTLVAIKQP